MEKVINFCFWGSILAPFSLLGWMEGMGFPLSWEAYLTVVVIAGFIAIPAIVRGLSRVEIISLLVFGILLVILYEGPWTSRKQFLAKFNQIHQGMMQEDVENLMSGFMTGSGFPNLPVQFGDGSKVAIPSIGSVRLEKGKKQVVIYRHSNDGRFNGDWGIVYYSGEVVEATQFSFD